MLWGENSSGRFDHKESRGGFAFMIFGFASFLVTFRRWELELPRRRSKILRRSEPFDVAEWSDAIPAFDDDEEEVVIDSEDYDDLMSDEQLAELPGWLASALALHGNSTTRTLADLTEREAEAITERYLSDSKKTQLDVACTLDVSLARASQLETQARNKLTPVDESFGDLVVIPRRRVPSKQRLWYAAGNRRKKINKVGAYRDSGDHFPEVSMTQLEAQEALVMRYLVKDVGYFYFKDDLELDDDALATIVARHGRVLAQKRETLQAKGDALMRHLGGRHNIDAFRQIIRQQPTLLGLATATIDEKMAFIKTNYDVDTPEKIVHCLLRAPGLLTSSIELTLEPALESLRDLVKDSTVIKKMMREAPQIARSPHIETNADLLTAWLYDGDADSVLVDKILARVPGVLALKPETLDTRLDGLQDLFSRRRKMKKKDNKTPRAAVERWPRILLYRRTSILKMKALLVETLGKGTDIAAIAARCPSVFARSKPAISAVLAYLIRDVNLGSHRARKVVERRPQALTLNIETNLKPALAFLRDSLHLDNAGLADLVFKYPEVLGLSIEKNLKPKLAFLDDVANGCFPESGHDALTAKRAAVLTHPPILGYSLERRLRPRINELRTVYDVPFDGITRFLPLSETSFRAKLETLA